MMYQERLEKNKSDIVELKLVKEISFRDRKIEIYSERIYKDKSIDSEVKSSLTEMNMFK